jgi:hypothetical protein
LEDLEMRGGGRRIIALFESTAKHVLRVVLGEP